MKVLLTARQPGGGIRTFFRYIYGRDDFADTELHLIAPDQGLGDFFQAVLPQGRISLEPVPHSNQALFERVRKALKGDYDLVHSHGFSAGVVTEIANTGRRMPHLMTAHDVFLKQQFMGWKGKLKHAALGHFFRRMEGVHTVTDEARTNFLEFFPGVRRDRIHDILHGVDTDFFREGVPLDHRQEFGLDDSTPLIGFFGRFMAQKAFRVLVDAMDRIVASSAVSPLPKVITFGWGGFIREDYAYVRERGLEDHFIQAPQTDNMPGALKGVDVVAMPSRWEACGLLAMETLASGVPIVGTDCVGLNEVLRDTPARVVPVNCSEALAVALTEVLLNDPKQEFLDFQPEACRRFDIARPASSLRQLYSDMVR
jgi:glycosyltransferase involved in cell wall biosynthesis